MKDIRVEHKHKDNNKCQNLNPEKMKTTLRTNISISVDSNRPHELSLSICSIINKQ